MATAAVTTTFSNTTLAKSAEMNDNFDDLIDFANDEVLHRDGSKVPTAAIPMGSNKLTGLGAATANGDAVRFEQHTPITIVDAKGDLIVASAADTFARLAVGSNDHVLTADSAESVGAKWAALVNGGKVPVIDYKTADQVWNTTPGTWQDLTDLSFTVAANERWHIEVVTFTGPSPQSPGSASIRIKPDSIPAGAGGIVGQLGGGNINFLNGHQPNLTQQQQIGDQSQSHILNVTAWYYEGGANGGTLTWEITNPSGGAPAGFIVKKGSHIIAYKLN